VGKQFLRIGVKNFAECLQDKKPCCMFVGSNKQTHTTMTLTNEQVKRAAAYFEARGFTTETIQDVEFGPQLLLEFTAPNGRMIAVIVDNTQVAMLANSASL
jgi:hypothetical protein